jgi:mRNA interferase MazF
MKRGEVYLVNFGKKYNSEVGKVRPAVIIQNDVANRNIDKVFFKGVSVLPLTTSLNDGDLRVLVKSRENLKKDSEICINEICTLNLSRIDLEKKLTQLKSKELEEVEKKLRWHLHV